MPQRIKPTKKASEDLERARDHLRTHIGESGFNPKVLAQRIGMSSSGLTKMLQRNGPSIKLTRFFQILNVIGVPKERFFGTLYHFPTADLETQVATLTSTLLRLGVVTREQLRATSESDAGDDRRE
jgi:hypothetical protein